MNTIIRPTGLAHKAFALLALFALVIGMVPMQASAQQARVLICKKNNSGDLSFNAQTVNVNAIGGLADSGLNKDIVPPIDPEYPTGINWTTSYGTYTGQQIWENDCNVPALEPTTGTLTVTKVVAGIDNIAKNLFSYVINGGSAVSFQADGSNDETLLLDAYTVVESGVAAGKVTVDGKTYDVSYSAGCSGTLTITPALCTITNTYVAPPASCTDGILNQDETSVDVGGVCTTVPPVVNGCTNPAASNYNALATQGNPDAANCTFPQVTACSVTTPLVTTNLSTWDLTQTRATGHNEIIAGGLRIYTESNTSTDKAAGYYTTDFSLSALGTQTIADALDYQSTIGIEPGLQLVVDFDNNGTPDGILVGEAVYGSAWWLSNSAAQFVKDNAPNNGGGYGSLWYGTPNEWLTKFPQARVKAIGYSLGSGVYGDGVIKSINLGCTLYTFELPPPPPVCKVGSNLLSNASFEAPALTGNGTWGIFNPVLNWTISGSNGLELWRNFNGSGAGLASDGAQNAELDGTAPTTITQTVATIPGATYELRYDFSARAGRNLADNAVEAYADTMLVSSTSADGTSNAGNVWATKSATFVAADASTDITFVDKGAATSYGSLLDNTVLCFVSEPVPVDFCPNIDGNQPVDSYVKDVNGQCYTPITSCSVSVVSNTSNTYNTAPAVEIVPNGAWVQTIASSTAKWIWGVPSTTPIDPAVDEVQTFKKTFVWSGTPSTAVLKLSSDNGYSVKLNGVVVGSDAGEFNYQSLDTINLTNIIVGVNTLEISVTNKANGQTSLNTNPGGLLYDLTVTNTVGNCAPGDGDGDGGNNDEDTYRLEGYVWHDDNENQNWDENFVPEQESFVKIESPLAGWTVNITNGSTTLSTTTDATGYYYFEVPAGTWTITETVQDGWDRTTQESYVVTVPQVLSQTFFESVVSFIIPTAYAAVLATYDGFDFGNNEEPTNNSGGNGGGNGGGGGNRAGTRDGEVLGISDSPEPLVLGEQVSAVPTGAPNTGKGGSAVTVLGQFLALPRRREV
jgi:Protein of unknown function (DUF642)